MVVRNLQIYCGKFRFRWPAVCIHGDKTQQERDWVLQGDFPIYFFIIHSCQIVFFIDFRSGKAPILVATDVAARGLGKSSFGLP